LFLRMDELKWQWTDDIGVLLMVMIWQWQWQWR